MFIISFRRGEAPTFRDRRFTGVIGTAPESSEPSWVSPDRVVLGFSASAWPFSYGVRPSICWGLKVLPHWQSPSTLFDS